MHKLYLIKRRLFLVTLLLYLVVCTWYLDANHIDNFNNYNFFLFFLESDFTGILTYLYLPFILYIYYLIEYKNIQFTILYSIRLKNIETNIVDKFKSILFVSVIFSLILLVSMFIVWMINKEKLLLKISSSVVVTSLIKFLLIILFTILVLLVIEIIHIITKDFLMGMTINIIVFYINILIYSIGTFYTVLFKLFGDNKNIYYNYLLLDIWTPYLQQHGVMEDIIITGFYFIIGLFLFFLIYKKQYYRVLEVSYENY